MGEKILQSADAAQEAGVTPSAIGRAVREGRLRVWARTRRGIHLFRPEDVAAYVTARRQRAATHRRGSAA